MTIAELLVEAENHQIGEAKLKMDFQSATPPKPCFGGRHDRAPEAPALNTRIDTQIIDPAAAPFEADHGAGDDSTALLAYPN